MTKVTILTAISGVAAKTVSPDGKTVQGYNLNERQAGSFTFEQRPVESFADLVALLDEVERDRRKLLIRGVPTPLAHSRQAQGRPVWRLKNPHPDDRMPTFEAAPQDWFMIDVDDLPVPAGMEPTSEEALTHLVRQLPREFHDVRLRYQFSNSAHPSKGVIKVHLFGLLDRPVDDADLRETAQAWNEQCGFRLIDPALFDPVQQHFVAPPLVVGGPDPLAGRRTGVIGGTRERVELRLRTRHGRGVSPASTAAAAWSPPGGDVERDETGKLTDGRESHLLRLRLEVLRETRPETLEEFERIVWERFSAAAKLEPTPGMSQTYWTREMVAAKCRADWPKRDRLMGRKPVAGIPPLYPSDPVPLHEADAEARRLVAGYFAEPRDMVLRLPAGLGKTRIVVEALAGLPAGKVAYYTAEPMN